MDFCFPTEDFVVPRLWGDFCRAESPSYPGVRETSDDAGPLLSPSAMCKSAAEPSEDDDSCDQPEVAARGRSSRCTECALVFDGEGLLRQHLLSAHVGHQADQQQPCPDGDHQGLSTYLDLDQQDRVPHQDQQEPASDLDREESSTYLDLDQQDSSAYRDLQDRVPRQDQHEAASDLDREESSTYLDLDHQDSSTYLDLDHQDSSTYLDLDQQDTAPRPDHEDSSSYPHQLESVSHLDQEDSSTHLDQDSSSYLDQDDSSSLQEGYSLPAPVQFLPMLDAAGRCRCSLCPMTFASVLSLRRHLLVHSRARPFACSQCPATFNRADGHQRHMRSHSEHKPHACKVCGICFLLPSELRHHVKRKHTRNLTCETCGKRFGQPYSLRRHMATHIEGGVCSCTLCGKPFSTFEAMDKHVRHVHHIDKPYSCDECGLGFATFAGQRRHLRENHGGQAFQCSVCQRVFDDTHALYRHVCYSMEPLHKCNICGDQFETVAEMGAHRQTHTLRATNPDVVVDRHGAKPFACKLCGRRFRFRLYVEMHLRTHSDKRPFSCPKCGAGFKREDNIRRHLEKHCAVRAPSASVRRGSRLPDAEGDISPPDARGDSPLPDDRGDSPLPDDRRDSPLPDAEGAGASLKTLAIKKVGITTAAKTKSYRCTECNKRFSAHRLLMRHLLRHLGRKQ